jgi:hypothetical protein
VTTGTQETAELVGALVEDVTPVGAVGAAKILRLAGRREGIDLWPSPGSGARAALFKPSHLINLLLALQFGRAAHAAETVARYRAVPRRGTPCETMLENSLVRPDEDAPIPPSFWRMTTTRTVRMRPEYLTEFAGWFPDTLGAAFDTVLLSAANPNIPEASRGLLRGSAIEVAPGRSPRADVVLRTWRGSDLEVRTRYAPPAPETPAERDAQMIPSLVFFRGELFEKLATILVGTWVAGGYDALLEPGGPPMSAADETAASPAREAAAPGDPPATTDGCPTQAHPRHEREKPQPPSVSRVGHLPLTDWGVTDADKGRNGAAAAAAAQARRAARRSQAGAGVS